MPPAFVLSQDQTLRCIHYKLIYFLIVALANAKASYAAKLLLKLYWQSLAWKLLQTVTFVSTFLYLYFAVYSLFSKNIHSVYECAHPEDACVALFQFFLPFLSCPSIRLTWRFKWFPYCMLLKFSLSFLYISASSSKGIQTYETLPPICKNFFYFFYFFETYFLKALFTFNFQLQSENCPAALFLARSIHNTVSLFLNSLARLLWDCAWGGKPLVKALLFSSRIL